MLICQFKDMYGKIWGEKRGSPLGKASTNCLLQIVLFCGVNSLRRTCISAGTALGAHFGVDRILVTFRDCANGTFIDTSAASDTIVTNYVSHCVKFLMISTNYGGQK